MLFDAIREEIFTQVKNALPPEAVAEAVLEVPPDPKMGDFGFPIFKLAKAMRKAPPMIAKDLAAKLAAMPALTSKIEISALGPYVNFTVKREVLVTDVLQSLLLSGDGLASKKLAKDAPTVIMEFSSPNVAKPFNIYHLRSTMIGNTLARTYAARGFRPVAINHLGDWGTQYGTLAVAYEMWGDDAELDKRGIEYLVELYVRINKEIEGDEKLQLRTREYFTRLEKGDPAIRKLWEKFLNLSLDEFRRTYERLNVHFDHYWGESFYIDKVPALEKLLKDKGLLLESQGAQVVEHAQRQLRHHGSRAGPCLRPRQNHHGRKELGDERGRTSQSRRGHWHRRHHL
ncbi:MAG: arginine--tRNA ligase [Deltaproteobacteria bacterium]|nr:arginine--tRNA ligase [Deltaproteobacteria bacterium]